jgi:hypothetical protein
MTPHVRSYRTMRCGVAVAMTLATTWAANGQPATIRSAPSNAQLVRWLGELQPLPKVHYSWPLPKPLLDPNNPLLIEYVRLTHAASISAEYTARREFDAAVIACKLINAASPAAPATLAINYSPWHRRFPQGLPPTDRGPGEQLELREFRERMTQKRDWLADANSRYRTSVRVSALLLDTERWKAKPPADPEAAAWNDALDRKYNLIFDAARQVFPDALIIWAAEGFEPAFTGREKTDGIINNDLYQMPDIAVERAQIRATLKIADRRGFKTCAEWLALGCGGYGPNGFRYDADYDPQASWQIGAILQGEPRIKFILFWPEPFSPRVPTWGRHFVAYVRGVHGMKELPWSEKQPTTSHQP